MAVADILWQMPRALGWIETQTDQVILLTFALRLTDAGLPILDSFSRILRKAYTRYSGGDSGGGPSGLGAQVRTAEFSRA